MTGDGAIPVSAAQVESGVDSLHCTAARWREPVDRAWEVRDCGT